jgi:hypothetical protein
MTQFSTRIFSRARRLGFCLTISAGIAAGAFVPVARADEAISSANKLYAATPGDKRSDAILLPLLAKLEAPPPGVSTLTQARLTPASSSRFADGASWSQGASQKAVLDALAKITAEPDWKKAYAFVQPYGVEGVSPELIRAGLYTDLGDPPTLAWAKVGFMDALDRMETLVNVEASRLAAAGDVSGAIDVLMNFAYFARQMCDRQFFVEAQWGLRAISRSMERIRDVAFKDMQSGRKLDTSKLRNQIERIADRGAYLDMSRMKFPEANRIGARQIVERLYSGSTVRQDIFPATMARLGTRGKPLRLFSESAKWRNAAAQQAPKDTALSAVSDVYGDWTRRWELDYYDRQQGSPTFYGELDRTKFSTVVLGTPDLGQLIHDRQQASAEIVGARSGLAVLGQYYTAGNFPPQLTSTRPAWIKVIDADPYNPLRERGALPPMRYLVPERDTPNKTPITMDVVAASGTGSSNFTVPLRSDVFVIYSRGTDLADNNAKRIENTTLVVQGADYILWPPMLSLYRQHLIDRGDIE